MPHRSSDPSHAATVIHLPPDYDRTTTLSYSLYSSKEQEVARGLERLAAHRSSSSSLPLLNSNSLLPQEQTTTTTTTSQDNKFNNNNSTCRKREATNALQDLEAKSTADETTASDESPRGPLKKRKKHLDVLRRNGDLPSVVQVSPVSDSDPRADGGSFDSKEAQPLTEAQKVRKTSDIGTAEFFPNILHTMLNHEHGVVQWLDHGQSWRVVRWDALSRQVLPKYFADGSIDAFLTNVRSWGFEEIRSGPEVGAYFHRLFVRMAPQLCGQMRKQVNRGIKTETSSLLRVPSLAGSRSEGEFMRSPEKHSWYHLEEQPHHHHHHQQQQQHMYPSGSYGGWQPEYPVMYPAYERHHYSPTIRRTGVSCPPPHDVRYPFRQQQQQQHVEITPPVHAVPACVPSSGIRSGRGGLRTRSPLSVPPPPASSCSYRLVSQRGGKSASGVFRTRDQQPQQQEQQRGGSLSARVAAISRRAKRTLPLQVRAATPPNNTN